MSSDALGFAFLWFAAVCAALAWARGEWDFKRRNDALNREANGDGHFNHGEDK